MNNKAKLLISSVALAATIGGFSVANAAPDNTKENSGSVLFKIHDISPEKDVNGLVTECNISVTLYNRYNRALSNTQLTLIWDDEVIDEAISQEDMAQKETLRRNPQARTSRYPTSGSTSATISTTVKLPLINAHQQISLKNKINTDRCFLLLNDMEVKANSCTFVGDATNAARNSGCNANFQYVSPKDPQYYTEFKEITYEETISAEEKELDQAQNNNSEIYTNIINTLSKIGN